VADWEIRWTAGGENLPRSGLVVPGNRNSSRETGWIAVADYGVRNFLLHRIPWDNYGPAVLMQGLLN
jgi:hypothetical protein